MAGVDPAQRWGISAGVPSGMTVEIKNGWLPRATLGWRINSIGCVSGTTPSGTAQPGYCLAVLTDGNPTMAYGVQTVSGVARAVNQDLDSPPARRVPVGNAGRAPATTRPSAHRGAPLAAGAGGVTGKGGAPGRPPPRARPVPRSLPRPPAASCGRPRGTGWAGPSSWPRWACSWSSPTWAGTAAGRADRRLPGRAGA